MELLFQIFALSRIIADIGTWRMNDYLSSEHAEMIMEILPTKYDALKRHVAKITDSFYPPEELMDSFLAPDDGDLYGSIVNRIMTAPNCFERHPDWRSFYGSGA